VSYHKSVVEFQYPASTALQWGWSVNGEEKVDQQQTRIKKKLALVAGIIGACAVSFPASSLAVDFSSFAGGASNLLSSTSTLMDAFTSTGFYQAFSLVFLSEIGDKTFFIAGLLAMKTSRFVSYVGSMGALAVMTLLSVLIGQIFHVVPAGIGQGVPLDDIAAVAAFTFFGFKTLKEAYDLDPSQGSVMDEELAEAEAEVEGSDTVKQVTRVYVVCLCIVMCVCVCVKVKAKRVLILC
jgi:putative Ca2+/H+ antiporter (TMEM165/GDT1 family)